MRCRREHVKTETGSREWTFRERFEREPCIRRLLAHCRAIAGAGDGVEQSNILAGHDGTGELLDGNVVAAPIERVEKACARLREAADSYPPSVLDKPKPPFLF
jgi:hypothetical protein